MILQKFFIHFTQTFLFFYRRSISKSNKRYLYPTWQEKRPTTHKAPQFFFSFGPGVSCVVGNFSKIQNLIVDVAKNTTFLALYSTLVEFLDHIYPNLTKRFEVLRSET